ncbi:LamG domain-containing protein, partial [bacterium]|nr:LamG domain-containing protein [bacterium]
MNNVQFTVCFIVLSFLCFSPLSEVHATPVHNYALYYSEAGQGVRVFDSDSIDVKDSMTIEAWVKPDIAIYDKASYIISKQLRGTGYMLRSTGYDRGFLFEAKTVLRGTTPEPIDEWVHVAGVYGSGSIRLYVNGILDAEQIAPIPLINEQDLYIGHSIFG